MPLPLVTHAVVAAVAAAAAWTYTCALHKAEVAQLQRTQALAALRGTEAAYRHYQGQEAKKDAALKNAQARQSALARDAVAARDAAGRVSHAADSAMRRASDSHEACIASATAQGNVLNQCSARLVEVAGHADQHVSDIQTLSDSWPEAKHGNDQD